MQEKECCCRRKKDARTEEQIKVLTSRINRIVGQLNGVKKMIEDNRYCQDVLIQLSAVDKAVKSLSGVLLEEHLRSCVAKDIQEGNLGAIDEVLDLFGRFQ